MYCIHLAWRPQRRLSGFCARNQLLYVRQWITWLRADALQCRLMFAWEQNRKMLQQQATMWIHMYTQKFLCSKNNVLRRHTKRPHVSRRRVHSLGKISRLYFRRLLYLLLLFLFFVLPWSLSSLTFHSPKYLNFTIWLPKGIQPKFGFSFVPQQRWTLSRCVLCSL